MTKRGPAIREKECLDSLQNGRSLNYEHLTKQPNKFQRFFIQKVELNQITWVLFNQFAYTTSKINKGKHYLHTNKIRCQHFLMIKGPLKT